MVTGNAGAGKTTLAQTIAADLGLPAYSLDAVVWKSGWRKRPQETKNAAIEALIRKPAWVIDGVSEAVEQAADVVVFLDVSRRLCVWRCMKRSGRYFFRSRPGLPDGCPEWRIIPRLLRLIVRFDRVVRPAILARAGNDPRYVRFHASFDPSTAPINQSGLPISRLISASLSRRF